MAKKIKKADESVFGWRFDNSYALLPEELFSKELPAQVKAPKLIRYNKILAKELGLKAKAFETNEAAEIFSGNKIPDGALPLAQSYAGHQFSHFTNLGDGRAIMLGEIVTKNKQRFDIQLKGSGQTKYSRRGDGKAALGPVMREYIISEAMNTLKIPTTRSLCFTTTGEPVFRETVLPGAILTRVAKSHIRVGTFEFALRLENQEVVKTLADYVIERHYPEIKEDKNPYLSLLQKVMKNQASLIAKWMHVGFIHGVMNTDNMLVSGETIDYGPCAFMEAFDPATVFSSIDRNGRYAYGNQPPIAQWNLARFAETILHLFDENEEKAIQIAEAEVNKFPEIFGKFWLSVMLKKLGIKKEKENDIKLIEEFLNLLHEDKVDFTNSFRFLSEALFSNDFSNFENLFANKKRVSEWLINWQKRIKSEGKPDKIAEFMLKTNPAFIPRNHLVEEAIKAGTENGDFTKMDKLMEVLQNPFDGNSNEELRKPAPLSNERYVTFCGT